MADQLNLYNEALTTFLGERSLASLTEERGPRRQLDAIWDREFVQSLLEEGQWNFAMRTMKLDASTSIEPAFGRKYAFEKPTDLVRVTHICRDEFYNFPLLTYQDEANFWFSDYDEIFIRYVSDDNDYGNDLANWPQNFTRWAASVLAQRSTQLITQNKIKVSELDKVVKGLLMKAKSVDAMKDPTRILPRGRWTSSREGSRRAQDSRHAQRGPA